MKLEEVFIQGYKSIGSLGQRIQLGDITVLLGANGAGKSNLVSFFKMLNYMTTGALQKYVGNQGASNLLFYGPKTTEELEFQLKFQGDDVVDTYKAKLHYAISDRLFVSQEQVHFHKSGHDKPYEIFLKGDGSETKLIDDVRPTCKVIKALLASIRVYHFHDTSDTARIKDRGYIDDAAYLRSDAGNLAAFLRMLKGHEPYARYYQRIVRHIQRVMPQFGDFALDPLPGNQEYTRLNWQGNDLEEFVFSPHQISDGSLRFMALASLLLQPPDLMPKIIVLDEPELGLHPAAIAELAGIIRTASRHAQVIIATQSTRLVDEFSPEQVVVVERNAEMRSSVYRRLVVDELQEWLERYSMSELWEKNILGGRP